MGGRFLAELEVIHGRYDSILLRVVSDRVSESLAKSQQAGADFVFGDGLTRTQTLF